MWISIFKIVHLRGDIVRYMVGNHALGLRSPLTIKLNFRLDIPPQMKILNIVQLVLSGHSKIDKTKILMTNGSLMKVKSISDWSILQYFWPALSDNRSRKPSFFWSYF